MKSFEERSFEEEEEKKKSAKVFFQKAEIQS